MMRVWRSERVDVAPFRPSRRNRPSAFECHGTLQRRGFHIGGDRYGPAEPDSVDPGLGGFLDDATDHDGQVRCAVEHQHPVVGEQDRWHTRDDCSADVPDRVADPRGP